MRDWECGSDLPSVDVSVTFFQIWEWEREVIRKGSLSWQILHRWYSRTLPVDTIPSVCEKLRGVWCSSHVVAPWVRKLARVLGVVSFEEKCSSEHCFTADLFRTRNQKLSYSLVTSWLVVLQKQMRISFATHFYFHTVQLQPILNDGQSSSFSFQDSLCVNLMFTKWKVTLSNSGI